MELNITHNPEGKPTSDRSCCSHWNGNCGKSVQQCPPTPNNYCKKCNRVFVDSQTPFKLLLLRHQCCALYYLTRNVVITSSQSQVIRHGEELHILTEGYHSGTHHNTSNFFKEGPHNHVAGYGVVSVPMFHESRPIIVVNLQTWMIGNWGENEMRLTCRCYNHLSHFLRLLLNHMPVSSFFTLSHPLLGRTHILPLVWWALLFSGSVHKNHLHEGPTEIHHLCNAECSCVLLWSYHPAQTSRFPPPGCSLSWWTK